VRSCEFYLVLPNNGHAPPACFGYLALTRQLLAFFCALESLWTFQASSRLPEPSKGTLFSAEPAHWKVGGGDRAGAAIKKAEQSEDRQCWCLVFRTRTAGPSPEVTPTEAGLNADPLLRKFAFRDEHVLCKAAILGARLTKRQTHSPLARLPQGT
jgi:hypothetical protein